MKDYVKKKVFECLNNIPLEQSVFFKESISVDDVRHIYDKVRLHLESLDAISPETLYVQQHIQT